MIEPLVNQILDTAVRNLVDPVDEDGLRVLAEWCAEIAVNVTFEQALRTDQIRVKVRDGVVAVVHPDYVSGGTS